MSAFIKCLSPVLRSVLTSAVYGPNIQSCLLSLKPHLHIQYLSPISHLSEQNKFSECTGLIRNRTP